jgi:hypothetical protein
MPGGHDLKQAKKTLDFLLDAHSSTLEIGSPEHILRRELPSLGLSNARVAGLSARLSLLARVWACSASPPQTSLPCAAYRIWSDGAPLLRSVLILSKSICALAQLIFLGVEADR